jgi:hypothetical protein
MVKENAWILDATAANRCFYETKESPFIHWIDIEEDLTIKPDSIMDCRKTNFPDKRFKFIIFDPPQSFGDKKNSGIFTTPNKDTFNGKWPIYTTKAPRYYGTDKYSSSKELLQFIDEAQGEFHRILQDEGIIFMKWAEARIKLKTVLELFGDWIIIMKIPAFTRRKTAKGTYWVLLMKK